MAITAADVNKLRQMTGAGMMDCKKALTECEGDFEKAIDYLRKKGQKVAANRADKEAKEYVLYLLETNPSISKKQAQFLSTHCTVGRYYTIQHFKSYCKVAYETARTSMDKLAALGYYEKLQVKNKFVYTPVLKGRLAK